MNNKAKLLIGCFALVLVWWYFTPKPAPVGSTVIAKPAPELRGKPQQDITPPKVKVYTPPAKKALGLPADVQDDPNKYVLGSARLPSDTHPHNFTTVIDARSGIVQTYDTREPLPMLAAERRGFVQIGPGYRNGVRVWRTSGAFDMVRIKAFHFGADGTLDNDLQRYVGLHIKYEF
jgi:hypothetical protein